MPWMRHPRSTWKTTWNKFHSPDYQDQNQDQDFRLSPDMTNLQEQFQIYKKFFEENGHILPTSDYNSLLFTSDNFTIPRRVDPEHSQYHGQLAHRQRSILQPHLLEPSLLEVPLFPYSRFPFQLPPSPPTIHIVEAEPELVEGSESEADFIDGMAPPKLPPPASSRRSVYRWDKDDRDDRMSQVSIKSDSKRFKFASDKNHDLSDDENEVTGATETDTAKATTAADKPVIRLVPPPASTTALYRPSWDAEANDCLTGSRCGRGTCDSLSEKDEQDTRGTSAFRRIRVGALSVVSVGGGVRRKRSRSSGGILIPYVPPRFNLNYENEDLDILVTDISTEEKTEIEYWSSTE